MCILKRHPTTAVCASVCVGESVCMNAPYTLSTHKHDTTHTPETGVQKATLAPFSPSSVLADCCLRVLLSFLQILYLFEIIVRICPQGTRGLYQYHPPRPGFVIPFCLSLQTQRPRLSTKSPSYIISQHTRLWRHPVTHSLARADRAVRKREHFFNLKEMARTSFLEFFKTINLTTE